MISGAPSGPRSSIAWALRSAATKIEAAREKRGSPHEEITVIRLISVSFGICSTLATLGIARKKFPLDQERVRWKLNPWIVEAALARLGSHRLIEGEQREVWANTHAPEDVQWPEWWSIRESSDRFVGQSGMAAFGQSRGKVAVRSDRLSRVSCGELSSRAGFGNDGERSRLVHVNAVSPSSHVAPQSPATSR